MSILLRKSFSIQIATVKSTAQHHLAPFCCLSCKAIEVVTDFEQALCVFSWIKTILHDRCSQNYHILKIWLDSG